MIAQYKPYRDEDESLDGMETTAWTDTEPGTVQIYEKTTEELPFSSANKDITPVHIALFFVTSLLGFMLGYYGPFHHREVLNSISDVSDQSTDGYVAHDNWEDPTIKDKILNQIDGLNILKMLTAYNDTNRLPGSDSDHAFALQIQNLFAEYGFDPITATNDTFRTMLPSQASIVKLLDKQGKILYSNIQGEQYPHEDMRPFLPLSQAEATNFTTNQILYLNKGSKSDYDTLSSLNFNITDINGKVVVIRQTFFQSRDAVVTAQEAGAKAVLLFPDPELFNNSPFPETVRLPSDTAKAHPLAWNNYGDLASMNLSIAERLDLTKLTMDKDSKVAIPVIPISFNTAHKLLRGLLGSPAPPDWNCFDFTLYIGPLYRENEDQRDRVQIEFFNHETSVTTSTITGIIPGSIEPDRYVVLGSRRDSLNRGMLDSVSGTAVMMEIARVYGQLIRQGWKPRRTIIFNSFGAESFNLMGSSNWLETHQALLNSRAVAFINCDLVVTGNLSVAIAASPLLYQVLYNATKQVDNPNINLYPNQKTTYDAWKAAHKGRKPIDNHDEPALVPPATTVQDRSKDPESKESDNEEDSFGFAGVIYKLFRKSADVKTRPNVRRLDLHSIYSPFFLSAGIPVVDVRHTGFTSSLTDNNHTIIDDTLPLIGTKYDNLAAVQRIDPHLKYHVAVAQIIGEILRDLSDSVYIPFNLLDYAEFLKNVYDHFVHHHGKVMKTTETELDPLLKVVDEFAIKAAKFHQRQDRTNHKDCLKSRKFNDQLMMLERALLDQSGTPAHYERKHIILTPNDGQDHSEGFSGLVDWISMMDIDNFASPEGLSLFVTVLKAHYNVIIHTLSNAIKIIDEVYML